MDNSLSLCVICKNEEKNIGNLLKSVQGDLFDEIVIVDTGSTDRTLEVIEYYTNPTPKVHVFKWINHFSAARNNSFSHAKSEYIMWLDSDDIVKPEDYQKLLELKKRLHEAPMWLMKYEYAHDAHGNSICSFFRERIIKRSLGLKWEEPIHEYLPIVGGYKTIDIEVQHNQSHSTSDRNIPLLEDLVEANPDKGRNVFYLGKELFDVGRFEEGVKCLERFIYMHDAWSENKYSAFQRLSSYYKNKKDYRKAKDYLLESIREEPLKSDAYCNLGEICLEEDRKEEAIHWYKTAANMIRPSGALDIVEPKYNTWLPHLQLCVIYNSLGMVEEASLHNEKALAYLPQDVRMRHNREIFKKSLKGNFLKHDLNPHIEKKEEFAKMAEEDNSKLSKSENKKLTGKIGWYCANDRNAGTIRIRMLNVNDKLKEMGYNSELFDWNKAGDYNIVVIKSFVESDLRFISELRKNGAKVICDMSEDITFSPLVQEILKSCDASICCSYELSKRVSEFNPEVITIEDAVEYGV